MPFITLDQIIGEIPAEWRNAALEDSATGEPPEVVWEKLQESIDDEIASCLTPAYSLPAPDADPDAAPLIRIVRSAARVFTLATLFRRRAVTDEMNPWASLARDTRKTLTALGQRQDKGPAGPPRMGSGVKVIGEPSRLTRTGRSTARRR